MHPLLLGIVKSIGLRAYSGPQVFMRLDTAAMPALWLNGRYGIGALVARL